MNQETSDMKEEKRFNKNDINNRMINKDGNICFNCDFAYVISLNVFFYLKCVF